MGVITQITDRIARMQARLLSIYKGKPNMAALLRVIGRQFQELEDSNYRMQSFVGRRLAVAEGDMLNKLGKLVGESRGTSVNDAEYRLRIGARIRANRSTGTPRDIYRVFRALLGAGIGTLQYMRGGFGTWSIRIDEQPLLDYQIPVYRDFLADAKAEGTYGVVEFYQGALADVARYEVAAFLNGSQASGATSLTVYSTEGFPDAGDITIDTGTATQESRSYTGRTATTFTGLTATSQNHDARATVYWDDSPGLGLGDANDPDVGGNLAGARGH